MGRGGILLNYYAIKSRKVTAKILFPAHKAALLTLVRRVSKEIRKNMDLKFHYNVLENKARILMKEARPR